MEPNEAASNATKLFSDKHATYARFIASVRYPQGLRAFFRRSSLLRSDMRVLDAGCGTGAATLAVHDALVQRGFRPTSLHAFDLTPAMLERFGQTLETRKIEVVEAMQANVLNLEALPAAWADYDLIVTASMLEYVPPSGSQTPWQRFAGDLLIVAASSSLSRSETGSLGS